MDSITYFAPSLEKLKLSEEERRIIDKLTAAAQVIGVLYERQKNPALPGSGFYPPNTTRQEVENAAKQNPGILSPYTLVERDEKGNLIAVPYSRAFKKELKKVAKLLLDAADVSQDISFRAYLRGRANDLLCDNYDESNILWLQTENAKIGFVIGAFDRYLDKLFFVK